MKKLDKPHDLKRTYFVDEETIEKLETLHQFSELKTRSEIVCKLIKDRYNQLKPQIDKLSKLAV